MTSFIDSLRERRRRDRERDETEPLPYAPDRGYFLTGQQVDGLLQEYDLLRSVVTAGCEGAIRVHTSETDDDAAADALADELSSPDGDDGYINSLRERRQQHRDDIEAAVLAMGCRDNPPSVDALAEEMWASHIKDWAAKLTDAASKGLDPFTGKTL